MSRRSPSAERRCRRHPDRLVGPQACLTMEKWNASRKSGAVSKALVVRPPWIEKILRRQKTWELRSRRTKARGPIGLIESRSGMVVGICDVVDVVGPLSLAALRRTVRYHKVPPTQLSKPRPYKKTYAWVLRHARRLNPPNRMSIAQGP